LNEAVAQRRGDRYFYRGLYGNWGDLQYYTDSETADYVCLTAPFDLSKQTIPGFIQILKSLGSTVNFDYAFSLGESQKVRSAAQYYLYLKSKDQSLSKPVSIDERESGANS